MRENIEEGFKDTNICILLDSQAPIMALHNFQIYSKLVWVCHQSMLKLAECNRVQPVRVPEHLSIDGKKIAAHLAREGSSHPLTGPDQHLECLKVCQGNNLGLDKWET